ncbi:MAG TPA: DinB family protein, partial [Candidatus Polarisedimenticolia bacterium]|nr:DinB family protein [Candidatus Polarisedimenticolia bacterium]
MPQIASWEKPRRHAPGRLIDRDRLVAWYRRNRERSRLLFDLLTQEDTHYSQPIALRHPFIFYEGHIPTFSLNTLVKRGLGETGIDTGMEALFARGIDPPTDQAAGLDAARHRELWPSRRAVVQFTEAADARVIEALMHADIERPGHPLLDRAEAAFVILEHEVMHQETLLYMLHRLPFALKRAPEGYQTAVGGAAPRPRWIEIGPGGATLGTDRQAAAFAWDNEGPRHSEAVP